jgi:stage III sporulation protein AH
MKQVWKRRAVVAAVLLLVGTSVYLNWRYAGNVEDSGKKVLGQSALVNGEAKDAEATGAGDDYFATARLSRKQARDTAIGMLQEAQVDENAAEDVLNEASRTLQVLAAYTVAESQIESLVVAKGYADCVVFMGEETVSVVVSDPDGLDAVDVARIKDIVVSETGYTPEQIKIMEAGAAAGSVQTGGVQTGGVQTAEQTDDAK